MFIGDGIVDELTRHIINLAGTLMLGLIAWMLRKGWKTLGAIPGRLDHLDECLDSLKMTEKVRYEEAMLFRDGSLADRAALQEQVADLKREYAGLEGYFKGVHGLSIDRPITDINPKEGAG